LAASQKGYFDKPFKYLFFDFLILSSPLTGLLAIIFLLDPNWRERPRDWWKQGRYEEIVRSTLLKQSFMIALFSTMCASGVTIFIFHLLGMIH
jgi:hypothetical protein